MIMMMMMVIRMVKGQGTITNPIPFTSCLNQCMFFCLVGHNNPCDCTYKCYKKCLDARLAPPPPATKTINMDMVEDENAQNLGYCKLGCATSLCSNLGLQHDPGMLYLFPCVCD